MIGQVAAARGRERDDGHMRAGAARLRDAIAEYWRLRSFDVHVRIEEIGFNQHCREILWVVRSDLVNGLPCGFRKSQKWQIA